jgi:nucleotide-binding universal stress UspA family protein
MKKFLVAFDGLNYCSSAAQYAVLFAGHSGAHLVGVFLDDFMRRSYGFQELVHYEGSDTEAYVQQLDEKDEAERKKSIEKFEQSCREAGVHYTVHRDRNVALQEILEESIYADLLIVKAAETLTRFEEPPPSRFIKDLLNDVQCPVMLVPEKYEPFDKIVMLYDGEPSSVFAVRSFSYLFDSLKGLKTEILTVKDEDETLHLPKSRLMKEFIKRHYPNAEYNVLKGDAETEIIHHLQKDGGGSLLILGAYRRSRMSRLFRPSMADRLMQQVQLPLFIAHNKS